MKASARPNARPASSLGALGAWIHRNSWPIGIVTILAGSVGVDAMLVTIAMRQRGSAAPESDYYDKAVRYDEQAAIASHTREIGLRAEVSVAQAPLDAMPRRVDVTVRDRDGKPVSGLRGTLTAVRPADARLSNSGALISVPDEPGVYRLLLKLPVHGLWEFQLDARNPAGDSVRMTMRKDVSL